MPTNDLSLQIVTSMQRFAHHGLRLCTMYMDTLNRHVCLLVRLLPGCVLQVVPNYSTTEDYDRMFALGVTMYGQMTAGSYCYIGPQGIVHGTTVGVEGMGAGRGRRGGGREGGRGGEEEGGREGGLLEQCFMTKEQAYYILVYINEYVCILIVGYICTIGGASPPKNSLERTLVCIRQYG